MFRLIVDGETTEYTIREDALAAARDAVNRMDAGRVGRVELVGHFSLSRDGEFAGKVPGRSESHWSRHIRRMSPFGHGTGGGRRNIRKHLGDS